MTYLTELSIYCLGRWGLENENHGLPDQCQYAKRGPEGDASAESKAVGDFEQAGRTGA
jgi:hypothetical protein